MNQTATLLQHADIENLQKTLKGSVLLPSDNGYDQARKVYNAMIDKHPALLVRCTDVADVQAALQFAKENHLIVAVRGGGHNGGGLGICDDGMVIDLSAIKYVRVDPAQKTVRVGGGSLLGEMDHATHAFGLAVPAGVVSSTGIGGLTLGGGIGYLSRKGGLTIDNLLEADMVLADGSFVTVNEQQMPDLFWAIRGGGGNFGIVTSFLFRAHEVDMVYGGVTLWPIENAVEIMGWYDQFLDSAPVELGGFIAALEIPGPPFPGSLHHKKFCGIVWCYSGDLDKVDEIFKPVREKQPVFEHLDKMPFPAIQAMFDGLFPPGLQWYWKADFFKEFTPELCREVKRFGALIPTPLSQIHLYPLKGAVSEVGNSKTPWGHRDAKYAGVIIGVDPDPDNNERMIEWCRDFWEAMHPYASGGSYLNFEMSSQGDERVKSSYGQNYERLLEIKRRYDPDNFFSINQNIRP